MRKFIVILLVSCSLLSFGQSAPDSLQDVLDRATTPDIKYSAHFTLAEYYMGNDPMKAISHYQNAIEYAKEIGHKDKQADAICGLADVYQGQGNYSEAEQYYHMAIDLHGDDKAGVAQCMVSLGELHQNRGDYDEAIEHYYEGLELYEQTDDKKGLARTYDNMGNLFSVQGNYDEALASYHKSITIDLELGNRRGAGNTYNNIGVVYDFQGEYHKAVENYRKAIDIFRDIGYNLGEASCLINIGIVFDNQGRLEEALVVYHDAVELLTELNSRRGMAIAFNNLGELYLKMKDYQNAEHYFVKGLMIAREIGAKSTVSASYSGLTRLKEELGDYRSAFSYQSKYMLMKDSLANERTSEKLAELRNKYRQELKSDSLKIALQEAKLAKLEKRAAEEKHKEVSEENESQQFILMIALVALIGAVTVAYFALRNNRLRQRVNRELQQKNFEISQKSDLLDKRNRNMLDSMKYAQRIQTSILPDPNRLDKYLSDSFVILLPKDIVSGDLYWLSRSEDRFVVTVADCTGHGVPGAFMSIMGIDALYQTVREKKINDPSELLSQLEDNIGTALKQKSDMEYVADGMEIGVCSFELDANQKVINNLKFAGANIHLWRYRDGELEVFRSHSQPLGGFGAYKEQQYPNVDLDLKKGDRFYMFSDGVIDQFGGPKGGKFKTRRVKEMLKNTSNLPMKDQGKMIEKQLLEWKGNREQLDDICFLGLQV